MQTDGGCACLNRHHFGQLYSAHSREPALRKNRGKFTLPFCFLRACMRVRAKGFLVARLTAATDGVTLYMYSPRTSTGSRTCVNMDAPPRAQVDAAADRDTPQHRACCVLKSPDCKNNHTRHCCCCFTNGYHHQKCGLKPWS